jgi:pimeloyl-ACP methyl ester carboxylesterase
MPRLGLGIVTAAACAVAGSAAAQSRVEAGDFDPAAVVRSIEIPPDRCADLVARDGAVRVSVGGRDLCLRYYAAGLAASGNRTVAVWMNGDILGPKGNDATKHQSGIGPEAMVAQVAALSARHGVPVVFLGRPGTYGSEGKHHAMRGRPFEAKAIAAALDALKAKWRIESFTLAGHSGGGTLVAEMLTRRADIGCAVVSSGASAHRAYLESRGLIRAGASIDRFDPLTAVDRIATDANRRIFVLGDPRETNVPFATQELWAKTVAARGHRVVLVPLAKATDARRHGLVDFGETAMGMCAAGRPTEAIVETLRALPDQPERISN